MRYFACKYALSYGAIREFESDDTPDKEYAYDRRSSAWAQYKVGRDAFVTEAEAKAAANKLRLKKIASLKKQIEKLERLAF